GYAGDGPQRNARAAGVTAGGGPSVLRRAESCGDPLLTRQEPAARTVRACAEEDPQGPDQLAACSQSCEGQDHAGNARNDEQEAEVARQSRCDGDNRSTGAASDDRFSD